MSSRKEKLFQRSMQYAVAIQEQRRQQEHDARRNPTYSPEPIQDSLAAAYERGYRDAISDLRRELAEDPAAKSVGSTILPLVKFLRPIR